MKANKIQKILFEYAIDINKKNKLIINDSSQIIEILNLLEKKNQTYFLYIYKEYIGNLLYKEDKIIDISNKNIDIFSFRSLFYLELIIIYSKNVINYSFNLDLINEVFNKFKENTKLNKYLSYLIIVAFLNHYKSLDEYNVSSEKKIKEINKEIDNFFNEYSGEIKELNFNNDCPLPDIEDVYTKIIIYLINNKKLEDYEYAKNIFEQMDMENIELTEKMFGELKNFFELEANKESICTFKIVNYKNLINQDFINFFFILFKYIFKKPFYIFNISFLLENRNALIKIIKKDYSKILSHEFSNSKEDLKNKQFFVINKFLDSEFYLNLYPILSKLNEVLIYFQNFMPKKRKKEINEIKEIISQRIKDKFNNYDSYYEEAQKMNKRYGILRHIYNNTEKNNEFNEEYFQSKIIYPWNKTYEDYIHKKKKPDKLKIYKDVFTYFNDKNNREELLLIFNEDEINYFVNYCIINDNLNTILTYYKNFFFESKKEDIKKINEIINSKEQKNSEEYMKYLETAKLMNLKYNLIKNLFIFEKKEEEIQLKLKELKNLEKNLVEEKYDDISDDIQLKLITFFNEDKNQEIYKEIINKKGYEALLKFLQKANKEILDYYKMFPKSLNNISHKENIESIEKGKLTKDIIKNYTYIKKMKLLKEIAEKNLELLKNQHEEVMEKMYNDFNEKKFDNIRINEREKLYNLINNKEEKNNEIIKKIFNEETINEFIKYYNQKKLEEELRRNLVEKEKEETKNKLNDSETNSYNNSTISTNDSKKIKRGKLNYKNKNKKLKNKQFISLLIPQQNNNNKDFSKIDDSTKDNTGRITKKEEEKIINIPLSKEEYIKNNIFEKNLSLLFFCENDKDGKKKITLFNKISFNSEYYINEKEFNKVRENLKDNKEKIKIYEFIDDFIEKLNVNYSFNFKSKIELFIEKKNSGYNCTYIYYLQNKNENKFFIERDILNNGISDAFYSLVDYINDFSNELKNEQILQINKPEKIELKENDETKMENKKEDKEYHILLFKKIMGNHNKLNKNYSAEFIIEVEDKECRYISGGTDKKLLIYDPDFKKIDKIEINEIKDWTYHLIQRTDIKDKLEIIACSFKEVYRVKLENVFEFDKYEMLNMACVSSLEMKVLSGDKNKNNIEINDFLIIVGKGALGFSNIFKYTKETNKRISNRQLQIIKDKSYKGICKLTETQIALTSNEIIPGGEDKLIIYNIHDETREKEIESYSFTANTQGMAIYKQREDEDSKIILLCACKKYNQNQKNGILLVEIDNEINKLDKKYGKYKTKMKNIKEPYFFDTKDFEVYCFCVLKRRPRIGEMLINDKIDYRNPIGFFLVGGYDNANFEGKIKLFKLFDENNNKRIKFLQNIEIKKNLLDSDEIFNGFEGAVSSLIQTKENGEIIASCYDGKVYLFSSPNLAMYGKNYGY